MLARSVMSDGVLSVAADATIFEAAELLVNTRVNAMPVLDESGVVVGMISGADVLRRVAAFVEANPEVVANRTADLTAVVRERARATRVVDLMTRNVVTADEDAPLREIAVLMENHGVERVLILRDQSVVGIVNVIDLLQALVSVGAEAYAKVPTSANAVDTRLRFAVIEAIRAQNPAWADRCDVVVSHGVVHLWGRAASAGDREACEQAVKAVPGVAEVANHLHVARR